MMTYHHFENSDNRIAYLSGVTNGTNPKDTVGIAVIKDRITDIQNGNAPENDDDLEGVTSARWKEEDIRSDSYFVGLLLFTVCASLAIFATPWMYDWSALSALDFTYLLVLVLMTIGVITSLLSFVVTRYRLKQFWQSSPGAQKYYAKKIELSLSWAFWNKFSTT
jgi:NADH:ubiquinone oxidoreductase subunit 3 (subunit A)